MITQLEWIGGKMAQMPPHGLLRSALAEGVPSKRAGTHSCFQTEGIYKVSGEAPGRSLGGNILYGTLTFPR
jgi:hypothetical protein